MVIIWGVQVFARSPLSRIIKANIFIFNCVLKKCLFEGTNHDSTHKKRNEIITASVDRTTLILISSHKHIQWRGGPVRKQSNRNV
jgi:hypothetical protein